MICLPLIIITTPNSKRVEPLLESVISDPRFVVKQIQATMGQDAENPSKFSIAQEISNYGRCLTQNERACAVSHARARKIIHESVLGGIILEDDARITDVDKLYALSLSFLQRSSEKSHILSLVSYFPSGSEIKARTRKKKFFRLLSHAPLAVGAAITPLAARRLVKNSIRYSMVADWPRLRCIFYILEVGVINHGDVETESIIGGVDSRVERYDFGSSPYKSFLRVIRRLFQKIDMLLIKRIQT